MRKIDRFLQYLNYKGISENKATEECNLAQGLLHQAKSGKSDLGPKSIDKILIVYRDLNKAWLLTGIGDMIVGETKDIATVTIDRDVLQTIISQQETIRGQLKIIEKLMSKENQKDVQADGPAECAGAHGA